MNNWNHYHHGIQYIIVGVFFFALLLLIAPPTHGEIIRIDQGSNVYLNGTYDISGVTGWVNPKDGENYIRWCGGYDCYEGSKEVILKLPLKTTKNGSASQYHYWIDPDYYGNRTGYWFQYDGTSDDDHGNTVAFRVMASYENIVSVTNHTINVNKSYLEGNVTEVQKPIQGVLPERPVSDYLLARGDVFNLAIFEPEKIWIFGRNGNIYDFDTFGKNISLSGDITQLLEPGSYYILHQFPGQNGDYDVRFFDEKIQWKTDWSGINNIDIKGVQPLLVKNQVVSAINKTDDTTFVQKLEVEEPSVTIEGFTEIAMPSTYTGYEYYRMNKGVVSLFDVRGYTNANDGTIVSVILDEDRHTRKDISRYTFTGIAKRNYEGNRSMYQVYVPIVWDDMTIGEHTLKVMIPGGASAQKQFPVSILPPDSYKPNATVKYAIDENPWKPNLTVPTPIVITKTIEVVKNVEVKVTPSQESVDAATFASISKVVTNGVYIAMGILTAFFVFRFIYRIIMKRKWYKK